MHGSGMHGGDADASGTTTVVTPARLNIFLLHMGGAANYLLESYALLDSVLFAHPDAVVYVFNAEDGQFSNYL